MPKKNANLKYGSKTEYMSAKLPADLKAWVVNLQKTVYEGLELSLSETLIRVLMAAREREGEDAQGYRQCLRLTLQDGGE